VKRSRIVRVVLWAWLAVCVALPLWLAGSELAKEPVVDSMARRLQQLRMVREQTRGLGRIGFLTARSARARLYSVQYALAPTLVADRDRSQTHLLVELDRPAGLPDGLDRWEPLARSPDGRFVLLRRPRSAP
jgi:hypothetical protein